MRKEYDFSKGKRGATIPIPAGKTRITIRLDTEVIEWFRSQVESKGGGNYQTMINNALSEYITMDSKSLEDSIRRVAQEENLKLLYSLINILFDQETAVNKGFRDIQLKLESSADISTSETRGLTLAHNYPWGNINARN